MPRITISDLPNEILDAILDQVVEIQQREGVAFTYGLQQLPDCSDKSVSTKVQRYVRGPTPPYQLRWDAVQNLRLVCTGWHRWTQAFAFQDVYVKIWQGGEKWFDLTTQRHKYEFYEMVQYPRGFAGARNPFSTLKNTLDFLDAVPTAAAQVKRLWFNGLIIPESDALIWQILRRSPNLRMVHLPWTVLRHGTPADWAALLADDTNVPLRSLELIMTTPSDMERAAIESVPVCSPLFNPAVSFEKLTRLKISGSTDCYPITDSDLYAIARTARNIEEFTLTCVNTVTIDGVMAIVRACRDTLRVLEHSPREQNGFGHPDPGNVKDGTHICEVLAGCPKLRDLSVSLPSVCSVLFDNTNVHWKGECQVRARALCNHQSKNFSKELALRNLLQGARTLIDARGAGYSPEQLSIEIFFAGMIFDPHLWLVHGDFNEGYELSYGSWPGYREPSLKGPYGSSGVYGKLEEDYKFEMLEEDNLFTGVGRGYVKL